MSDRHEITDCPIIEGLVQVRLSAEDEDHPRIDAAVAEIFRLRLGWLRMLRNENQCDAATAGQCSAAPDRCGCAAEMAEWKKEPAHV